MDDTTARLLARYERRMANANRYYDRAEAAEHAAEVGQRQLNELQRGDPVRYALERESRENDITRDRERAALLRCEGDGIQSRMCSSDTEERLEQRARRLITRSARSHDDDERGF